MYKCLVIFDKVLFHFLFKHEIQRYLSNNENHLHIVKTTEGQVLIPVVLHNLHYI